MVGQPQGGQVLSGQPVLYIVNKPSDAQSLTVTLNPSFGDPDLYVTLDGTSPNATNFAYKSTGASGSDTVTISPSLVGCGSQNASKCYCTSCDVRIAVTSFSPRAIYTIIATTDTSLTALQDGQPYRGAVTQFKYFYFVFQVSQPGASVSLTLTALGGDPDLTAALTPNPTLANGTWVSLNQGGDAIVAHNIPAGTMYIGVFGFTNSSFSLTAHVISSNNTQLLLNGRPTFGSVNMSDYSYYAYSVDVLGDLTFTVTPVSGTAKLYVNTCVNSSLTACNANRPTAISNTWNAGSSLSGEVVHISHLDPGACSNCYFIIGVLGVTNSDYIIIGSTNQSSAAVDLQESVPFRSSVAQWAYTYFVFTFFDTHSDVVISVTPFTGDPDLYVTACFEAGNNSCVYQPTNAR